MLGLHKKEKKKKEEGKRRRSDFRVITGIREVCCNGKQFFPAAVGLFANSTLRDRRGYDQGNYEIRQSSPFSLNISFSEQSQTLELMFRLHLRLD